MKHDCHSVTTLRVDCEPGKAVLCFTENRAILSLWNLELIPHLPTLNSGQDNGVNRKDHEYFLTETARSAVLCVQVAPVVPEGSGSCSRPDTFQLCPARYLGLLGLIPFKCDHHHHPTGLTERASFRKLVNSPTAQRVTEFPCDRPEEVNRLTSLFPSPLGLCFSRHESQVRGTERKSIWLSRKTPDILTPSLWLGTLCGSDSTLSCACEEAVTLYYGQEDNNYEEEEGDVEDDPIDLILVTRRVLDLVTNAASSSYADVHVEHVALRREGHSQDTAPRTPPFSHSTASVLSPVPNPHSGNPTLSILAPCLCFSICNVMQTSALTLCVLQTKAAGHLLTPVTLGRIRKIRH